MILPVLVCKALGQKVTEGEPVTLNWRIAYTRQITSSPFKPGGTWCPMHPGKWCLVACVEDRYYTVPITVSAAQAASTSLTFESPATGNLEYVIFYLYDHTGETPKQVCTPMDIYRETVAKDAAR